MPAFGQRSLDNLKACHPDLRRVLDAAILRTDFTVTTCQRGKAAQEAAHAAGNSNAHFGQSPHNYAPALAVDIIPSPFAGWDDPHLVPQLEKIARIVQEEAVKLGLSVDWGGDWHSLKDYPHLELSNWKSIKTNLAP